MINSIIAIKHLKPTLVTCSKVLADNSITCHAYIRREKAKLVYMYEIKIQNV